MTMSSRFQVSCSKKTSPVADLQDNSDDECDNSGDEDDEDNYDDDDDDNHDDDDDNVRTCPGFWQSCPPKQRRPR